MPFGRFAHLLLVCLDTQNQHTAALSFSPTSVTSAIEERRRARSTSRSNRRPPPIAPPPGDVGGRSDRRFKKSASTHSRRMRSVDVQINDRRTKSSHTRRSRSLKPEDRQLVTKDPSTPVRRKKKKEKTTAADVDLLNNKDLDPTRKKKKKKKKKPAQTDPQSPKKTTRKKKPREKSSSPPNVEGGPTTSPSPTQLIGPWQDRSSQYMALDDGEEEFWESGTWDNSTFEEDGTFVSHSTMGTFDLKSSQFQQSAVFAADQAKQQFMTVEFPTSSQNEPTSELEDALDYGRASSRRTNYFSETSSHHRRRTPSVTRSTSQHQRRPMRTNSATRPVQHPQQPMRLTSSSMHNRTTTPLQRGGSSRGLRRANSASNVKRMPMAHVMTFRRHVKDDEYCAASIDAAATDAGREDRGSPMSMAELMDILQEQQVDDDECNQVFMFPESEREAIARGERTLVFMMPHVSKLARFTPTEFIPLIANDVLQLSAIRPFLIEVQTEDVSKAGGDTLEIF